MGRMSTIAGRLVLTGTIAGVGLWVMVNRAGLAQDAKRDSGSVPAPELTDQNKPEEPKDVEVPARTVVPGPAALSDAPSPVQAPPEGVSPPLDLLPAPAPNATKRVPSRELIPADDRAPVSRSSRQPFGTDDPEKDAQAFAEQNRKLAESQLKTLKEEEARLRARLQKVESGIERWQALLEALTQSESVSVETLDPVPRPSVVVSVPLPAGGQEAAPHEKGGTHGNPRPAARLDRELRPAPPADKPRLSLPAEGAKPR